MGRPEVDRPRYSVIIPFFNAERFLTECLDSVVAQTCGDWECICVDDGSVDGGLGIVEEYAKNDARFTVLHLEHSGVGAARNAGMEKAAGKYLVFVDADDSLRPDALRSLSDETADIVTFLDVSGGGSGRKETFDIAALCDSAYSKVFDRLAGNLLAWNAIYAREQMQGVLFPNLVNCEDLVFCAEAFSRARTITAGVPKWYFHREVEGSAANSHSWRRTLDSLKSIPRMFLGYCRCIRGWKMAYVLMRKLALHFILHVLAEIPKSMSNRSGRYGKL